MGGWGQANLFSKEMGLKIVISIEYQRVRKISLMAMPSGKPGGPEQHSCRGARTTVMQGSQNNKYTATQGAQSNMRMVTGFLMGQDKATDSTEFSRVTVRISQ